MEETTMSRFVWWVGSLAVVIGLMLPATLFADVEEDVEELMDHVDELELKTINDRISFFGDFRVRYDTDIEQVRKIIKKKVYMPIMQNEELAPKLLDAIKSQGVREMDDSAMIMRIKFKTAPGQQFIIRKEVYRLMQEAFQDAGIEFAHRNVTVYMPPGTDETEPGGQPGQEAEAGGTPDQKLTEKAAAAAIAVAQAEADEQKPK